MEFRILGSLELSRDGQPIRLTPKEQALLAALLLRANEVVPADRLIEQIWGDLAGATRNNLQALVRRLRRSLQPGDAWPPSAETLITRPPGYLLMIAPMQLDAHRFEELVARARRLKTGGDLEQAAGCLRSALALWRGPALSGVSADGLHRVEATRLEERRLEVLQERIELDLLLGRPAELVGELTALVAEHPLREQFHAQLMLALYRSGRQADALNVYLQLSRMLREELGLEPSAALQRLQVAILKGDQSLDQATAPPAEPALAGAAAAAEAEAGQPGRAEEPALPGPVAVRPCQLPPDIPSFTGRRRELERIEALVDPGGEPGPPVIVAIDGAAGVGKSALATHAAHRLAGRFPDGQLYVDLHGATAGPAPLEPRAVLARFLRAFGLEDTRLPAEAEERAGLWRSLLAGRRVLVVLDNAIGAAQVRLLLPASSGSAALVTSRRHLAELDGAAHLPLDVLPSEDATALLGWLVGVERVAKEPAAAAELARLCGCLPLALRVAGARLAARPAWPLARMAQRLQDEHARLDELELGGLAVRASLQVAYQSLAADGRDRPDAARTFRLLSLLDGADVSVPVAAAVLDQPAHATEAVLERLVDEHLLDSRTPGRYRFHDLVRLFARERAAQEDPPHQREAAVASALHCYLAAARHADRLLRPGHATGPEAPTGQPPPFADQTAALAWLETERANLIAAIAQAAAGGPGQPVAWQLTACLFGFFDVRGYWDDWEQVNRLALGAAQCRGDRHAQAQAWRDLGAIAWRRFHLVEATDHLQRSLDLRRSLGDVCGQAQTLNSLGLVHTARHSYQEAIACLVHALALFRQGGDRRGEGQALNNLGDIYRGQGRFDQAVACLRQDLAICRELGDRRGEAITLCNLGRVYRDQGDGGQAFDHHQQSLLICEDLGDRRGQGLNLDGLGEARRLQGRPRDALAYLRQALSLLHQAGDRFAEAEARWHLGLALDALGRRHQADPCLRQALAAYQQLQAPEARELQAALSTSAPEPGGL